MSFFQRALQALHFQRLDCWTQGDLSKNFPSGLWFTFTLWASQWGPRLQRLALLPSFVTLGMSLVFPVVTVPPSLVFNIVEKWSWKCSHCQGFQKKRERSGDKDNPRTTVTVECKDNLRIAVKPKNINAWFWNGSSNLGSLLTEL